MADPTPLILSRTESETPSSIRRVEGDEKYIPPSSSSSTLDETIEQCLGDFGCWWWRGFQIGLEMISFFSACTAFNVLLIYTIELFPTCVRNSAMSMVRQAVVLGGVFGPVLVAAGRNNSGLLSYGVFGVTIGLCGLFVTFLPETRGHTICDTMDEEKPQT